MKSKYLFLFLGLFITNPTFANDEFNFVSECIEIFSNLDRATTEFHSTLENNNNSTILKTAITEYNNELVLSTMNKLSKYSNSKNQNIKEVATDLSNIISDLVKMNYEYLKTLNNSENTEKELNEKTKSLIDQNKFVTGFFREISLGICMTLVKDKPNKNKDEQYSKLTLEQRNMINEKLINEFGETIKKGNKTESKTPFEYSSRLIYEFLNMEWKFQKK